MKTYHNLATAVQCIVDEFGEASKRFSAYDITQELRRRVNEETAEISNIPYEHVDGRYTQKIEHNDVRNEIFKLHHDGKLDRFQGGNGNASYMVYEVKAASNPVKVLGVNPLSSSPVKALNQVANAVRPTPTDNDVMDYINRKHKAGENPTLKQVQSRFKGYQISTQDISDIAKKNGVAAVVQASDSRFSRRKLVKVS